jgi:Cu2+-exporting ATPase
VFDKTGTLTRGRMVLEAVVTAPGVGETWARQVAAALEQGSEHAIASGLRGQPETGSVVVARAVAATTGQGVEGEVEGRTLRIGRGSFVAELVGAELPKEFEALEQGGGTVVVLGEAGAWLAAFRLADMLREDAPGLVSFLQGRGCDVGILSGDGEAAVAAVARQLAVGDYRAALSPQGKHEVLVELQRDGRLVAMVGDGVNDAPVLAQAQVSIAMGGGTDLARNQADIVLLREDFRALERGIALAARTLRITRQNLWWAFAYNFTAIPLAMLGWVTPWMAGIGMSASSLLVVLNALRLRAGH